jgi:hypothetical protein
MQQTEPANSGTVPGIDVYEIDRTARAETTEETYTGADIFDATQRAIDSWLAKTRPTARGSGEAGDLYVRIYPGYYEVANGLSITKQGIERIIISSPGTDSAYIDTNGITDGGAAITIDPGPVELGDWLDRIHWVTVRGLSLVQDSTPENRTIDGLYANDMHRLVLEDSKFVGYRRGLTIRNVWQGVVDNVWVNGSGVEADGHPAIQLGHPEDGKTHQATNHIWLNHLQGDPGNDGFGAAYLQAFNRLSRIDITFPNVELAEDTPGFLLTNESNPSTSYNIRGANLTGGAPAFGIAQNHYQFTGGDITASGSAIEKIDGVPKVSATSCRFGSSDAPIVDVDNCRLSVAGCKFHGGSHGMRLGNMSSFAISGSYFTGCTHSAITVENGNLSSDRGAIISGIVTNDVASDGAHPIVIRNSDNVQVVGANIVANDAASGAAIAVSDSQNVALDAIHAVNQPESLTHSNSSFVDTSPRP